MTAAVVWMLSGVWPASASASENAIEKHAECAAASSSSGLVVPASPSERAFQLTSNWASFEESRRVVPDPSKTLAQGAIDPWTKPQYRGYQAQVKRLGRDGPGRRR